jgi:hypothetical protein
MLDQLSQEKHILGLAPATTTDNTALVSAVLDRSGFMQAAILVVFGTLSDADATFTPLMEHSDASGSGFAAVDDADLIGTESGMGITFASDGKVSKLGYKGTKRYIRFTLTPAGNTGNIPCAMIWELLNPRTLPQSTQTN